MASGPLFSILGGAHPRLPVLITVPHAGRAYPPEIIDCARVPVDRLRALEDRHADGLVTEAMALGASAIVAHVARATIDLNRDPREIDPAMIEGGLVGRDLMPSGKVRAGLGLFPRRLPSCGELWRRRMSLVESGRRIAQMHEPYHRMIAERLAAIREVFGGAILIDCHSMPPLPAREGDVPVRIVVGDRFGAGASAVVVDAVMAVIESAGLRVARNHPYAGGYTIDRHGRPRRQVHAIQIEFDRALYLDDALDQPAAGMASCARLLAAIVSHLAAMLPTDQAIAAE